MRRGTGSVAGALTMIVVLIASCPTASAATVKVNVTGDEFGGPPGPTCSLREAVQSANTNTAFGGCTRTGTGNADTIKLQGDTTYTRAFAGVDDVNAVGDLDITGETTIEVRGDGKATIDGNDQDRVIDVEAGGRLTASKLVITKGSVTPGQPDNDTSGGGIAVTNSGRLTLTASTVTDNAAPGNINCACGGGIGASGRTTLKRVRITGNNVGSIGGGLAIIGTGRVTVVDSTIAFNDASLLAGGIYAGGFDADTVVKGTTVSDNQTSDDFGGGGIYAEPIGGEVTIVNSTISGNLTNGSGGGLNSAGGSVTLNAVTVTDNTANTEADAMGSGGGIEGTPDVKNSIVAGNFDLSPTDPKSDCAEPTFGFDAHNLVGAGGGCPESGSNIPTANPKLKQLADYGGPTFTHALKRASRAVDNAGGGAPGRDQRGRRRDARPDIGAFER